MFRTVASCLVVAAAPVAQTITLAEGSPGSLTIVALAESAPNGAATTILQNVELLPIEITGRTLAQDGDASRSRRVLRRGIACVQLRDGGWLYRYRRSGGAHWGFLHVAGSGAPSVVLELPGLGTGDPFQDRIGVAPDGRYAAIAPELGGLYLVRLDGSVFPSTGRADRQIVAAPAIIEAPSMMVGSQVVWFQNESTQLFRCALADGSTPVDITPPFVPNAELKEEMAMTPDGSRIVFLYGPDDNYRLWRADLTGPAVVLPPPPSDYEEPDYLPDGPGEPAMLLNDSGARLFFVDSEVRDELYLLDLTGVLPALQITEDTVFQPYIGAHVLPKFAADALTIAIGDPAAMDWFRAELSVSGGTVTNLTGTGSIQTPFPSGTLAPVDAVTTNGRLLAVEQQVGSLSLRSIDPATGAQSVLHQNLLAAPRVGSGFTTSPDLVVRTANGDCLYSGASGAMYAQLPFGITLAATAHAPAYSATMLELANFRVPVLYLSDGSFALGLVETGLEQLALTQNDGLVLVGNPVRYLAPGVHTVLNRPPVQTRICLSGAGG